EAWPRINEVWGQEVPLFYEGLWAGTTDLVGVHDGIPTIMDYKNSRKLKTWEHIENYRMQIAAYALAHNQMHGTNIERGVIFICVRKDPQNLQYQEFVIEGQDFKDAVDMWIGRVEQYYILRGEIEANGAA
ncbi:Dna2/Cas4 domain-containing protein, partial [Escherichia coli]|nr:Dna2/Cas4 domain-containing protein [Escherichia coli]